MNEVETLKNLFPSARAEEVLKRLPRRSWTAIQGKADVLGIPRVGDRIWLPEEESILRCRYESGSAFEITKLLPNRTWDAITIHAGKMRLSRKRTDYQLASVGKLLNGSNEAYYWNGFLLADGHFTGKRIALAISPKDESHLVKFAEFIEFGGKIVVSKLSRRIACMDSKAVPCLMKFLDVGSRKTYHPPKSLPVGSDDQILSLVIGFIDGDGCIKIGKGRRFANIIVKCHRSWKKILEQMSIMVYRISGHESGCVKIDKKRYARWIVSNSEVSRFLKETVERLNLPVLERKWSRITKEISRQVIAEKRKERVMELASQGKTIKEIINELGMSYGTVLAIIKRNNINVRKRR
jgi:hypothetical protein